MESEIGAGQSLFPMVIPLEAISETALQGIIDEFILREGTDYGRAEVSHETKVQQVRRQLERGDALIVFDRTSETISLRAKDEIDGNLMGEPTS